MHRLKQSKFRRPISVNETDEQKRDCLERRRAQRLTSFRETNQRRKATTARTTKAAITTRRRRSHDKRN